MERLATRILGLISDVRFTQRDIEYLAWQMVSQSPRPMLARVKTFGEFLVFHANELETDNGNDY